jgi:hypothetical protein
MVSRVTLRRRLILFRYILSLFGVSDITSLRETLKREKETYDSDGRSYYFNALKGLNLKLDEETFAKYDENIKTYLSHINSHRSENILLKYFQYLSLVFTEIFLDGVFNRKDEFLEEINKFVKKENGEKKTAYAFFEEDDLTKLAYWMATGSGKTLIMHINYLQFHKYNKKPIDNILLITPNESLSRQHYEELRNSNIPAQVFNGMGGGKDVIQIIEIHKLTEEKKGEGVRVEVSSFEGNNLVFVDEGHKGFSGTAWKKLRDKISEIGFTFEYSATFDEAITAKSNELVEEYSKAIIMDYSYRYFYYDGFGKEFTVLNLKNTEYSKHKEMILLANLLSFYQQVKYYKDNKAKLGKFSFKKPLWIFVGNSVSSGKKDKFDSRTLTDLQFVVAFLNKFLSRKDDIIKTLGDMFKNGLSLKGKEGDIHLSDMFGYVKQKKVKPENLYHDILKTVFNSESPGNLELKTITNASGEVGLKVSTSEHYFALIYIGDVSSFKKGLEGGHSFEFLHDSFSSEFFGDIDTDESPINILMGSRRFIEGWNCYRVSTMGLLNMGKSKGSQIIQLFGRGVRLKGYNSLMKRTKTLVEEQIIDSGKVPTNIRLLETLNIFGIKADYVDTFKKQLEEEGISEEEVLYLKIKKNTDFLKKKLMTMKLKEGAKFTDPLRLEHWETVPQVIVDLRPKFESFVSEEGEVTKKQIEAQTIPVLNYLEYVNWDRVYFDLCDYKQQKEFHNLYISKEKPKEIMEKNNYKVLLDRSFELDTFAGIGIVEKLCLAVLQKYMTEYYNIHKRKWATDNLQYEVLKQDDENFQDYTIILDKKQESLIKDIKKLIKDAAKVYKQDRKELPTIVFDKHLYQPLIIRNKNIITIPTGLNESEEKLVKDLKNYFLSHKTDDMINSYEVYIFRNLSRKGVGLFAETNNFYPDFILWTVKDKAQKIAFIDPKGLLHGPADKTAKIQVRSTLKDLQKKLSMKNIELTSFIIAGENSPFEKVKGMAGLKTKKEFEDNNVLFQTDTDYVTKLIRTIVA